MRDSLQLAHEASQVAQTLDERLKALEGKRIRSVGKRARRVVMHFQEDSVDPGGDSGARQRVDVLRLAAAGCPFPARKLEGVGHVEDDRKYKLAHDGDAAHVDRKSTRLNSS